ncbi:MAG: hypothetical protein JWM82_2841 [Myxococcales bacterium]|nr:hypothetical protein [Myxococcales bacterium]
MSPLPRLAPRAAAFAIALALSGALPARASLIVALDTPAMVERSDHIAVVDVASVAAAWDDKHERILTTIALDVVEVWKGPMTPAARLTIVQPGGTVGDMQMTVFGMTRFSPGERALVFLRGTTAAANLNVVGMAQGKRLLTREAATGKWMVRAADPAGASFVRVDAASAKAPIFETRLRALEDLRAEIRDLVVKAKVK